MVKAHTQPPTRWPARVLVTAVAAAVVVLLLMLVLYVALRPAGSAYLLSLSLSRPVETAPGWRELAGSMPAFGHVLAFGLLTALLLPASPRRIWIAFLSWGVVNAAFEIAQFPVLAAAVAAKLPGFVDRVPVLDHLGRYLTNGTFDPTDVFASLLGAVVGASLLTRALKREQGSALQPEEDNRRDAT
jgi:hypothetical protein